MDRFIDKLCLSELYLHHHLKSSMDRFIARGIYHELFLCNNLKSSMDRFIVHQLTEKIAVYYI